MKHQPFLSELPAPKPYTRPLCGRYATTDALMDGASVNIFRYDGEPEGDSGDISYGGDNDEIMDPLTARRYNAWTTWDDE